MLLLIGALVFAVGLAGGWIARERIPRYVRAVSDPYKDFRDVRTGLYRSPRVAKGGG